MRIMRPIIARATVLYGAAMENNFAEVTTTTALISA